MTDNQTERQIAEFVDKYTPELAAAIRACRQKMRALIPRGYELVYDNYNALVFAFAPVERTSAAMISVAAYPRWVTLFFLNGVGLDDPESLLEGGGKQVRGITLRSPADLDRPAVRALIVQAMAPVDDAFAQAPMLGTIVKSVSAKQRPRRPVQPKPKAGPRGPA